MGRPGAVSTRLGAILGRLRHVLASPNRPKIAPRHHKKCIFPVFFHCFLCSEGFGQHPSRSWHKLVSKTPPRHPKELTRLPQERPRPSQETSRCLQDATKSPQETPRPPKTAQDIPERPPNDPKRLPRGPQTPSKRPPRDPKTLPTWVQIHKNQSCKCNAYDIESHTFLIQLEGRLQAAQPRRLQATSHSLPNQHKSMLLRTSSTRT